MKSLHDLRIAAKLIVSFSIVLALCTALGVFSIVQLGRVNQTTTDIETNWMPSVQVLLTLKYNVSRIRALEAQHVLSTDAEEMKGIEQKLTDQLAELRKNSADYAKLISEPEEKRLYGDFAKSRDGYLAEHEKLMKASMSNNKDEAQKILHADSSRFNGEMSKELDQLTKINDDGAAAANSAGDALYASSRLWIIGAIAVCIVLGFSLALWIARIVSRPLNEALRVAQTVASGDLTSNIVSTSNDETGQLMDALRDMNTSLLKIVGQVRSGTDTIALASSEIASGNLDLSSRTEQQAGSLEETASSMEELTSTVKHNTANAREANNLAASASDVATRGGAVVSEVVNTMGSINESSKKIVDIISVIDGIAFQTNILALNAAVEAARAGEQGRGFAVVASEVRNLAQRSAAAAKEIKALIGDSVEKVEAGSRLVNQAGSTMEEIVSSVKRVTHIIAEIANASVEQEAGINQINDAVTQMDTVTQQNAALVEQAAAAADSLQEQAKVLSEIVSVFKLDAAHMAQSRAQTQPAKRKIAVAAPAKRPALAKAAPRPEPKRLATASAGGKDDWEEF
jgi:methyl-accepting chemotaxis protein